MQQLVFVDTETTGLKPKEGLLLEVAMVIVDENLRELHAVSSTVAWPEQILDAAIRGCNERVIQMHKENELWSEVLGGQGAQVGELDTVLAGWLFEHDCQNAIFCGRNPAFDRSWVAEFLPKTYALFSHRSVDVTTMVELQRRWAPVLRGPAPTGVTHRALNDIRMDLIWLRWARKAMFLPEYR